MNLEKVAHAIAANLKLRLCEQHVQQASLFAAPVFLAARIAES